MKRLLFIVLLLLILVWGGLWVFASTAVSQAIGSNMKGQNLDGVMVTVNDSTINGFPTSLDVVLTDLKATAGNPALHWQAPIVRANFDIFSPTNVKVAAPGKHTIRTVMGDVILDVDVADITARLLLESALPLGDVSAEFRSVELRSADESGIDFEGLTGTFRRMERANYSLDVIIDNFVFTDILDADIKANLPEMYQTIENLSANATLELNRDLNRFILDESGFPRLNSIKGFKALTRLGNSPLILTGDFKVDEKGLLTGPLKIRVENWQQLYQAAIESGLVPQDIQGFLSNVLYQWSQATDEKDVIELPLQLKNGYIALGMFKLGFVPGYPKI